MNLRVAALIAFGGLVMWLERRRTLRPRVEPETRHITRNVAVAGLAAAAAHLVEAPLVGPLARQVERRRWGLVQRLPVPGWARDVLAALLMDYTLYVWHILTHRVEWLWRLHLVHHVDLDLDATTAVRFHFAEISASVPWRAGQIAVIGTSPRALRVWQGLTLASILFHHSNAALPLGLERRLARLLVTPRMHGIHHSQRREEADSNYSSGLAVWDWLHGTVKLDVPQSALTVGVPAYARPSDVSLAEILALPATHRGDAWRFRDGSAPKPRLQKTLTSEGLAP